MTGPENLIIVRHAVSAYNDSKTRREQNPDYQAFRKAYETDWQSEETKRLAEKMRKVLVLPGTEADTLVKEDLSWQPEAVGKSLKEKTALPDLIIVSPYVRTVQTYERMTRGWKELLRVPTILDPRIREREHGVMPTYGDKRIFFTFNPEERELFESGEYEYRYPGGENIEDVKVRVESWLEDLIKDHAGKRILAITHHETILVKRMAIEGLGKEDFLRIDKEDKPINCGVTTYQNNGENGLELVSYNQKLF